MRFGSLIVIGVIAFSVPVFAQSNSKTSESKKGAGQFEGTKAGDEKELAAGFKFRWCPAGQFKMGSAPSDSDRDRDEVQVNVTLTRGFWIGETEVTQGQWKKVMGTIPWKDRENLLKKEDDYPACYVSQLDAIAYCEKLTKQERSEGKLSNDWKFSLPTEAQWEYACRAGTTTKYSFGDNAKELGDHAWWGGFVKNGNTTKETYPHKGGLKKPNNWGLKDMHGNVWEWCVDAYDQKLIGGADPVNKSDALDIVQRGGGWGSNAVECRSAERYHDGPNEVSLFNGFRIVAIPSK